MADAAAAEPRSDAGAGAGADRATPDSADDFEFCILSSGGIVPAGKGAATDMCVADELFCQGKLLPLRPSSAAAADGATVATLPRSESAASTVGLGSRSGSRSASSSGSSSGCVSRSQSSKSASSDQSSGGGGAPTSAATAAATSRRSLSSSVFYAHPSPSPQLRSARPRRSTGSAQPAAAWGLFRLGVVGAPDVYPPPRPVAGDGKVAAARGAGSRSARFEQVATAGVDRKLGFGTLFADSLGCKCSPDVVVEPVEAAKRSRKKDGGKSGGVARRSRILDWLDELSIVKEKK